MRSKRPAATARRSRNRSNLDSASPSSGTATRTPPASGIDFVDRHTEPTPLVVQRQEANRPAVENRTGMPDRLKAGLENLSGADLSDVRVHYRSPKPAQLAALAYTSGADIFLGPGQERHLPHEAWHAVQQKEGRVKPTTRVGGVGVNDDPKLEREADVMGTKAATASSHARGSCGIGEPSPSSQGKPSAVQRLTGLEVELHVPVYSTPPAERDPTILKEDTALSGGERRQIKTFLGGGLIYGRNYGTHQDDLYDISADHGAYARTHGELVTALEGGGYIASPFLYRSMTNIEYRTPPLEEREAGATARLNAIAGAVKDHAEDTADKAKQNTVQDLGAPAQDLKSGVPKTALDKLVSSGDGTVKGAVTKAKNDVQPFTYFQTTTGVLPSEIPELFEQAAGEIDFRYVFEDMPNAIQAQTILLRESVKLARDNVDRTKSILEKMNFNDFDYLAGTPAGDLKSLQGWLTLVSQYLVGRKLEQSSYLPPSSTPKNLLAYLSKTRIVSTLGALPARIRPFADNTETGKLWATFFLHLISEAEKIDIVGTSGLTAEVRPGKLIPEPRQWLGSILTGTHGGETTTGNTLDLDAGQELLSPALKVKGEQAIPLEDRFSQSKITSDTSTISNVESIIKSEWSKAVDRRRGSTESSATDTAAQDEPEFAKYLRLRAAAAKWVGVLENKYHVGNPDLSGFKTRLNDNTTKRILFEEEDPQIPTFITNLEALRRDLVNRANTEQKTLNDIRHAWAEATYRHISYSWKDGRNFEPMTRGNAGANVYVKKADAWVLTTIRGLYHEYQEGATWYRIERARNNVKTYLSTTGWR